MKSWDDLRTRLYNVTIILPHYAMSAPGRTQPPPTPEAVALPTVKAVPVFGKCPHTQVEVICQENKIFVEWRINGKILIRPCYPLE